MLGWKNEAQICRHESSLRKPGLEALIAYEILYGVSLRRLFPRLSRDVERDVRSRAALLAREIRRKPDRSSARKLFHLDAVISAFKT